MPSQRPKPQPQSSLRNWFKNRSGNLLVRTILITSRRNTLYQPMYISVSLSVLLIASLASASPVCQAPAPSGPSFPTFGNCSTSDGQTGICQATTNTCPGPGFNVGATGCPQEGEVNPQIPVRSDRDSMLHNLLIIRLIVSGLSSIS